MRGAQTDRLDQLRTFDPFRICLIDKISEGTHNLVTLVVDHYFGHAISGLSAPERAPEIVRLVEKRKRIAVSELANLFGVSQVTMRQDLDALAQQALLVRIHGAALAVTRSGGELDYHLRLRKERQEKLAIARAAAARVADGDVVALDASTTAYYLALELKARREVVVVTNSLRIGSALLDSPQIRVVLTGGELRRAANSMVGELGQHVLTQTRIGKGFFGCQGLSLEDGLMDLDPEEVRLKRAMVAACTEPIGILDYTKWRRGGLLSFASASQISALITDSKAPNDQVAAWEARGIHVVRAQAGGEGARRPATRRPGRKR